MCFRQTKPKKRCLSIRHKNQTQHEQLRPSVSAVQEPSPSERTSSVHRLRAEAQHKPGHQQQSFLSPRHINVFSHFSPFLMTRDFSTKYLKLTSFWHTLHFRTSQDSRFSPRLEAFKLRSKRDDKDKRRRWKKRGEKMRLSRFPSCVCASCLIL